MRSFFFFLINAALTAALVALPRLEARGFDDEVLNALYARALDLRLPLLIGIALVQVGLNTFGRYFIEPRKKKRKVRNAILEAMRQELFDNERRELRITIFKTAGFWVSAWIWLRIAFRAFHRLIRRKPWWLPMKWYKLYQYRFIYIEQRLGTEYTNSSTFFFYHPQTDSECEGLASKAIQRGESISTLNLPDISNCDLRAAENGGELPECVQDYMAKTFSSLQTLRRLNVKALHFHGEPLYNPDTGKPIGVLMIDSRQLNCALSGKKVPGRIQAYAKMLNHAI